MLDFANYSSDVHFSSKCRKKNASAIKSLMNYNVTWYVFTNVLTKKDFFIVHCMQSLPVLIKFYELVKIKYAPK